ncbi:sigma-70 family RNA polymerase sigma factor [Lachnospiraceae bacterium ZAX-1]
MKKQYFIEIDGEQIPVSEEVYRAYKQPLWAEHKRKERSKRCQIPNGKGGLKRCEKDCSQCPHARNGSVLSLDCFEEDGYFPEDTTAVDPQQILEDALLLEALWEAVSELEPDNQTIIQLYSEGASEREIAAAVGLSQKGVNKRKTKLFSLLYDKLKDFE